MKFKSEEIYKSLAIDCPPKNYKPQKIKPVFRWTFEEINDERNFMTQYYKKPKRFQLKSDLEKCQALALSMFDNLEGSKKRFNELKEVMGKKAFLTLGTKIAKGYILENHGVNGNFGRFGHFSHHPAETTNYEEAFKIVENLEF